MSFEGCLPAECTHCFFNVGPWPVGGVGCHHFVMFSTTPSQCAVWGVTTL